MPIRNSKNAECSILPSSRKISWETRYGRAWLILRHLAKEASGWGSRQLRKVLPGLARAVAEEAPDLLGWVRAATSSLDRMAAIAAGDVSWVLGGRTRAPVGDGREERARAERLLAFVLSPTYLDLREQLGMGVR